MVISGIRTKGTLCYYISKSNINSPFFLRRHRGCSNVFGIKIETPALHCGGVLLGMNVAGTCRLRFDAEVGTQSAGWAGAVA